MKIKPPHIPDALGLKKRRKKKRHPRKYIGKEVSFWWGLVLKEWYPYMDTPEKLK